MKLKYLAFSVEYSHHDLLEDFDLVDNPTEYSNLPDGEYLIRGNKKGHRKEYWVKDNIWYLVDDVKKDNGHFYVDSCKYKLFPMLKHCEYEELYKHINKLSNIWIRNTLGYFCWLELRASSRELQKTTIKLYGR
jgi:hypothetical protein